MVGTSSGEQFSVDVKGQSAKSGWLVRLKAARLNLFYILVLVGLERDKDRFFVLTQKEANNLIRKYKRDHPTPSQEHNKMQGFNWKATDTQDYENAWWKLPG